MNANGLLTIFLERRAALLRFLVLRGAAADEAEDVLQDISLKLSGAGGSGPVADPVAYLYRMVSNHWLDQRRGAVRRLRREEAWVDAHSGVTRDVDQQPRADAVLAARQQVAALQAVLDALPERTRAIFQRFRIDGEPQREIAASLAISVSAVEKHLTRAYQAIAAVRRKDDGEGAGPRRPMPDG